MVNKWNKSPGLYHYIAPLYDFMDYIYEKTYYQSMRMKWIGKLRKERILEMGIGTGKNLPYYHSSNHVVAFDRTPQMLFQAQKRVKKEKNITKSVKLKLIKKCPWSLASNTFSIGIATFVLCTMDNPSEFLHEFARVLQSNGKLVLFEWVLPNNSFYSFFLKLISPITKVLFGVNFYRMPSIFYLDSQWKNFTITLITPYLMVVEIVRN